MKKPAARTKSAKRPAPRTAGRRRNPAFYDENPFPDTQPLLQAAADALFQALVDGPDSPLSEVTLLAAMSPNLIKAIGLWCGGDLAKIQAYYDATGEIPPFEIITDDRAITEADMAASKDPLDSKVYLLGIEPNGYGKGEACYIYVKPLRDTASKILGVTGYGKDLPRTGGLFGQSSMPPGNRKPNPLPRGHHASSPRPYQTRGVYLATHGSWVSPSATKRGAGQRRKNPYDFLSIPAWGDIDLSRPLDRFDLAIQRKILEWAHQFDYTITPQVRDVWPRILRKAMDQWAGLDAAATCFKRNGVVPPFELILLPAGRTGDVTLGDRDPGPEVDKALAEYRAAHRGTPCEKAQIVSVDGYVHPQRGTVIEGYVLACPRADFARYCGTWPSPSRSTILT